jgi:predicted flap endonuclease-1-like 5' DNA nuclease
MTWRRARCRRRGRRTGATRPNRRSGLTTLKDARDGKPDDLKKISGVGPKLEGVLNEMGFYHFDQIAAWTPPRSPGSTPA